MHIERQIDLVQQGSPKAVNLCDCLLVPALEHFATGALFKMGNITEVSVESPTSLTDPKFKARFTATYLEKPEELDEGEKSPVSFRISMGIRSSYEPTVYWPGHSGTKLAPGDTIIDEQRLSELTKADPEALGRAVIAVVWDYFIDNEYYEPLKQISWEYYADATDDMPVAIVTSHNPDIINNIKLSEDDHNDALLRRLDGQLAETFSEYDINIIASILYFIGYKSPHLVE